MRDRLLLTSVLLCAVTIAACQEGTNAERAFVELLGADTMAVEVFTRSADRIDGRLLVRSPLTRVARYSAVLDAEDRITALEATWETPATNPEGPGPQAVGIEFDGDSAVVTVTRDGQDRVARYAVGARTVPQVGKTPWSVAVLEQALREARKAEGDTVPISFLNPMGRGPSPNVVVREGADSVSLSFFGNPMMVRVADDGSFVGMSGARTTLAVRVEPAGAVDFEALANDFGARDAAGTGLGVASPRDTTSATIANANIEIDYSRPAARGRTIFGGLVAFGTVWRTGANAATHFTTTRDLEFGGELLPAGTYTLWTTYTAEGGELIVNEQTGQWGTDYDPARDLLRVPMSHETLSEPVERFTISAESTDGGGLVVLSWSTSRYAVPFTVR